MGRQDGRHTTRTSTPRHCARHGRQRTAGRTDKGERGERRLNGVKRRAGDRERERKGEGRGGMPSERREPHGYSSQSGVLRGGQASARL